MCDSEQCLLSQGCGDTADCTNATDVANFASGTPLAQIQCTPGCLPTFTNDGTCDQACFTIECNFDGTEDPSTSQTDCTGCPPGFVKWRAWWSLLVLTMPVSSSYDGAHARCKFPQPEDVWVATSNTCGDRCYPWMTINARCDSNCNGIGRRTLVATHTCVRC